MAGVEDDSWSAPDDDGSIPYFSTIPYKAPVLRSPKLCIGNGNKCAGWKSAGTDYCAGHQKSIAKLAAEVA